MSTLLEIFNRTLHRVGINDDLVTDSDDVPRADTLNLHWPGIRKEFLESFEWSWARSSLCPAILTVPQLNPVPMAKTYQYDMPVGSLAFRYVLPDTDDVEVEEWTDGATRYLLTNYSNDIEIVFTLDMPTVTLWPETAIAAVILLLAIHVETDLSDDDRYFERNQNLYSEALSTAQLNSRVHENQKKPKRRGSLAQSRKGVTPV